MTIRAPLHTRIAPRPRPAELLTWARGLPPGQMQTGRPFVQNDWPNPIRRRDNIELRSWFTGLIGDTSGTPLIPVDWPNPIRRVRNNALYSWTYSQQIPQSVAAAMPFTQSDRQNPQSRKQNPELRTWISPLTWQLTVGAPFRQTDWPNPVRRVDSRDLRAWVDSLNVASIGAPFVQSDWPTPVRRVDSVALRSWINGVQLQPVSSPPFVQTDWPNPIRRTDSVSPRTWVNGIQLQVEPLPLNQLDWPNPTRRIESPSLKAWSYSTAVPLSFVTVPNVVGEAQAQAEADIAAVGLLAGILTAYSDTVPVGIVISQSLAAGSLVQSGVVLDIVISLGPAPPPPVSDEQFSGGFFHLFERQQGARRKRKRELEEAEEAIEKLAPIDREIAQLLQERERKDDFDANLSRLKRLVGEFADKEAEAAMSERVRTAFARAQAQESVSAYLSLQRELERQLEEEEFAILMILANS